MKKRKVVETYIFELMDQLDPSGENTKRYKDMFKDMNDKAFTSYMKAIKDGKTQLALYQENLKKGLTNNQIVALAKKRKVKIFSKLRMTDPDVNREYLTTNEFLVVQVPIRRVSQYLFHKISLPEDDTHINPISGQVIPPDKGSKISSIEVQILGSKGLKTSILEMIKVRGGDTNAYQEMKHSIESDGDVSLGNLDLTNRTRSSVSAQILLRGIGIANNL